MKNSVKILVNGAEYDTWISYSVNRDLYAPEDPFSFKTVESVKINEGDRCSIEVNGAPLISGIIDSANPSYSKRGKFYSIKGRSLIGLAVDQYVTSFKTFKKGSSFQSFAKEMIGFVPILKDQEIIIEKSVKSLTLITDVKLEPEETVFEVLNRVVQNMGVLFYSDPKGNVVFGYPSTLSPKYSIEVTEKNGKISNKSGVISGASFKSSKEHYSNIVVLTQTDDDDNDFSFKKTFKDSTAPINKTIVRYKNDGQRTDDFGKEFIRQQRFKSLSASYNVDGHTSSGLTWNINTQVSVRDSVIDIFEPLLIYSVNYALTKKTGQVSSLRLGRKS